MIALIDYGMGNLHSVYNALKSIDCDCIITSDIHTIKQCKGIILPGVGAFKDCMNNLNELNIIPTLLEEVSKGKPLLGICLGMQVLFERGYEIEECNGLGILKGEVTFLDDTSLKIPHMGWNKLIQVKEDNVLTNKDVYAYYVHSYRVINYEDEDLVAYSMYGNFKIPGYIRKNNILGMQYHPEKSGKDGLCMLEKFKEMCL